MHFSLLPTRKILALLLTAILVSLAVSQVTAAPVDIAHWSLDGNAQDSVGGYNGVLSAAGAGFVPGGVAGSSALSLDRSQDGLVNLGPVTDLAGISYTISLWVKTSTTDPDAFVLTRHQSGYLTGCLLGINGNYTWGPPDKAWFFNYPQPSLVSSLTVNDGQWHHVVVARAYPGTVTMYVDGQFQAVSPDGNLSSPPPGTPLLFGGYVSYYGVPVSAYTGLLDDVQIYQGALTAQQILFLFQNPGQMIPMPWKTVPAINSLLLD